METKDKIYVIKVCGEIVACTTSKEQAWEIQESISLGTMLEEWFDRAKVGWSEYNAHAVDSAYGEKNK